ncbi:hypothetical protein ABPG72_020889 [Tetrahymena utriculariae]
MSNNICEIHSFASHEKPDQFVKQTSCQAIPQQFTSRTTSDSQINHPQYESENINFWYDPDLDFGDNHQIGIYNFQGQDNLFYDQNNVPTQDEPNIYANRIDDFMGHPLLEEKLDYQQQDYNQQETLQQIQQQPQIEINPDIYLNLEENNEEQIQNDEYVQQSIENEYQNLYTLPYQLNDNCNIYTITANTVNTCNQQKQRRDVKDDKLIERMQNLTTLDIGKEALRQFKNEIKKNTIRTILQKNNKNINQVRLQQYFNNTLHDRQVFQIYERINNIFYQLFPDFDDMRENVLVAFVQLYNENRTKFNYKNVKYLFQDVNSNEGEKSQLIQIVSQRIQGCHNKISHLIICAQKIFKEFFDYFLEHQLIPYLYSEYKVNTYPNERYPSPQYKQLDIYVTLYCVDILFIDNM